MMDATVRQDAISVEIFANLFKAIVDEMAWIVLRSSHTTFVKETQDFAVSLVTNEGEIFAYPVRQRRDADHGRADARRDQGVRRLAAGRHHDDQRPVQHGRHGDAPERHLPVQADLRATGELLCFAWTFIHCTDVGGYAPGSIDMRNNEVFQEGLRLRPVKLMRQGALNQELWNIFADNCRIPALNWGDITACIAALDKAERRLARLAERYGYDAVRQSIYATLDRTEQLARQVLARIPPGEYRFDEYFEDDYVSDLPVRITAKLICARRRHRDAGLHRLRSAGARRAEPADGIDAAPSVPVHGADQLRRHAIGIDPHQRRHHPLHRSGAAGGLGGECALPGRLRHALHHGDADP